MAFMSSLPSPILSSHLESWKQETLQPSDPGTGLAAANHGAGNRGVETRPPGNSWPLGICPYLHRALWEMTRLAFGFCRVHVNACTGGGRRDQSCVGALWCTKMLSKFWHFSLRDKAQLESSLSHSAFRRSISFLGPFIEEFKNLLVIPYRAHW